MPGEFKNELLEAYKAGLRAVLKENLSDTIKRALSRRSSKSFTQDFKECLGGVLQKYKTFKASPENNKEFLGFLKLVYQTYNEPKISRFIAKDLLRKAQAIEANKDALSREEYRCFLDIVSNIADALNDSLWDRIHAARK